VLLLDGHQACVARTRHQGHKPSTSEGWLYALGGTEEFLRHAVLGVTERGLPADWHPQSRLVPPDAASPSPPWRGYVTAHDGAYSDARDNKGFGATLLSTENSGAVSPSFDALLRRLDRVSREPGTKDLTNYGVSSSSPSTFRGYHLAAHSAAVVYSDVTTLLDDAATKSFWLARGMPDLAWTAAPVCGAPPDPL